MPNGNVTPGSKKTKFGRVPDYHKAKNELSEQEVGELIRDISIHENDRYGSAQEVARAFYEEDATKYNENQIVVRETAKENVDKHSQPDWAWELLSVYSEDMGKKLLDVPSDGSHKGLLIDEDYEKVFLYAKDDEIPATEHVNRWHDNGVNAQSIGYQLPADELERTAIDLTESQGYGEPVLMMDYNDEMILDSKIGEILGEYGDEIQDRDSWVNDSQRNREEILKRNGVENLNDWITGLEFLIENGYIENWGVEEYRQGKDNTAVNPQTLNRMVVDLGEFRIDDDGDSFNHDPNTRRSNQSMMMSNKSSSNQHNIY